jgi:tRNA threonylcarbamoyl adenosine modification protein YeaZ
VTRSGRAILVVDTATSEVVVALGTVDGELLATHAWPAGYRHGEQLLPSVERLLTESGLGRHDLAGIVVGTGPGAFTGLRVGLATAKALAHGLSLPLAGISTADALIAAAGDDPVVLLLPAGPHDRIVVRRGAAPSLLPGGSEPEVGAGERLVAVDLDGRAPADALAAGVLAKAALGAQALRLGAARLAADGGDDPAGLVPEYVTLPRGIAIEQGEVAWSRDRRRA